MSRRVRQFLPAVLVFLFLPLSCSASREADAPCGQPGQWIAPDAQGAKPLGAAAWLDQVAPAQVVLLGETHDSTEDHRWQLHVLAQLHARRPELALGLEMFPRRLQAVLDRWVAGEFSEAEFLRATEWERVWGFDARDYLPLFHYARMHGIPMLALNVERTLPEAIGKQGWDAVSIKLREGVSRPAPPSTAYLAELRAVFDQHPGKDRDEAAFPRFVEAQTVWDRAMAEVIAQHLRARPQALVVGILGGGHVRHGHGVPHQLKALGVSEVRGLLTTVQGTTCKAIAPGVANAVFVVRPPAENPPRLGIAMEMHADGIRIAEVKPNSVAAHAGLLAGDLIVEAAGQPLRSMMRLRSLVQRQTPGTELPLKIKRAEQSLELRARFPAGE
jgi:uncharacterized iron-regulated protein